jgi:hypothetical protein
MNTLLRGLRYGARRLRLSAQPQVFAKVVANWLIESPDLVLGPTDRPRGKWRPHRNYFLVVDKRCVAQRVRH